MAEAVRADALAQRFARETVSLLRRDCAKLLDALERNGGTEPASEPPADELRGRFLTLLAAYPRRSGPADISVLANGLEALALAVSAALTARVESNKISGSAAQHERHIQSSSPDVPANEWAFGEEQKASSVPEASSMLASGNDSAIRSTYPLSSVLDACPQVQDFSLSGIRSWGDLLQTADRIRPMLGISPTAWSDAQEAMGPVRTLKQRTSSVDGFPAMVNLAGQSVESEVVPAVAGRPVVLSPDSITAQVAQQQRSDTAVRDNGDVATAPDRDGTHFINGTYDAALRVHGLLPTADVLVGRGKEQIGHGLELGTGQVAHGRAIILSKLHDGQTKVLGQHVCAIARLAFRTAPHGTDVADLGQCEDMSHPLAASGRQRPVGDRHRGINQYVGVGDKVYGLD